jgi:hypothetical protein
MAEEKAMMKVVYNAEVSARLALSGLIDKSSTQTE